ncbi:MAG: hypothetical protein LBU91_08640 [Bacteroidales bacterium]|nr:hypothetical protein [Bacteroidales bacterium]
MKKSINLILTAVFAFLIASSAQASNIQIPKEPTIAAAGAGLKLVTFDLTWEFSWRSSQLRNYDAAWVFVKYRVGMDEWDHMYLDGDYNPATAMNDNGTKMAYQYGQSNGKNVGVFLYREANGQGDINWTGITLRWNYSAPNTYSSRANLVAEDDVIVRVFAVEMVFVPEGAFYLGDGQGDAAMGKFCKADELNNIIVPFRVESEGAIGIGLRPATEGEISGVAGRLSATSNSIDPTGSGLGLDGDGAIPAPFPKGFKAMYVMKYEITQSAYTDFLNTLTVAQQTNRIRVPNNSGVNTLAFRARLATDGVTAVADRNFIKIKTPGVIEFAMDANVNNVYDELGDGHGVACAMGKQDLLAYLDWSGLRPITELEYEKISRGPMAAVPGEYVWGNTYSVPTTGTATGITAATAGFVTNWGQPSEVVNAPVNVNNNNNKGLNFTTRNGAFATPTSDRIKAGATYWGVMEMGSNLAEAVVNMSTLEGRAYSGLHGDGRLDLNGEIDVQQWPEDNGMGHRGGNIALNADPGVVLSNVTMSDRRWSQNNWGHFYWTGGRGGRTVGGN